MIQVSFFLRHAFWITIFVLMRHTTQVLAQSLLAQQRTELANAKVHAQELIAEGKAAAEKVREELIARLRALIRRSSGQASAELRCGPIALDPRAAKVAVNGVPVRLTSHEFRVLSYLMHHRGKVVSQAELSDHIYAERFDRDSNTVEVFVARLRRKLGAASIETVRGLGYRMDCGAGAP